MKATEYIVKYEKDHQSIAGTKELINYTNWLIEKLSQKPNKSKQIIFKSFPDLWNKEFFSLKRNTLRKKYTDERFTFIKEYLAGECDLNIGIVNTKTGKIFYRDVTDVSEFDNYYIISW